MERVMLDVDLAMGAPGSDIDDGFALALAVADPEISLELVTTVNGNTDVATATALTLDLLHRLGHPDVPVHRGARVPLLRPQERQGSLPAGVPVREPQPAPAAVAMIEKVRAHPGQLTLVAVGPPTNVALAIRLDDGFASSLHRLVIMGGVFDGPRQNPGTPAEFNVWSDPEAAKIVLGSEIVAEWVGLDVTLQVRMSRAEAEALGTSGRPFASFAGPCTTAWIDHIAGNLPEADRSCPLHDPLAVAAVTRPQLLGWEDAHVSVDTGEERRGVATTTYACEGAKPVNARVARTVDAPQAEQLLRERLSSR